MAHKIFISYSTKDAVAAEAVCAALEASGSPCWIAPRDIPAGMEWADAIVDAVGRSEMVILLLSRSSNASKEVQREIALAAKNKLKIVTLRIENVDPTGGLSYYVSNCQYLDAFAEPLAEYLPNLINLLLSPHDAVRQVGAALSQPDAERQALEDVNWHLAEFRHDKTAMRVSFIDEVIEPALVHGKPMFNAGMFVMCDSVYRRTAEGILQTLEAMPEESTFAWPEEVQQLRESLRICLRHSGDTPSDDRPAVVEERVKALQRLFIEFVDRLPLGDTPRMVRPFTWCWAASFFVLSTVSLYLAYLHGTTTWDLLYRFLSEPPDQPPIGPYLEVARTLVILVMAVYLLESTLRSEYERLLLNWGRKSWRKPFVTAFRVAGLAMFAGMTAVVVSYVLVTGPKNMIGHSHDFVFEKMLRIDKENRFSYSITEVEEACRESKSARDATANAKKRDQERTEKSENLRNLINNSNYDEDQILAVCRESADGFDGHAVPYRDYLLYCWVNYCGFGMTMLVVTSFAVASDARRLVQERQGLFHMLTNIRAPDQEIDRAFSKFSSVCFQHTQRYITVLAWISGSHAFEVFVSKGTLTRAGLTYELLASIVVGASTIVWIGVLVHFYEGAFQRACAEKRRRRQLGDQWEASSRTFRFLSKCFFNHLGTIFAVLYIVPIMLYLVMRR